MAVGWRRAGWLAAAIFAACQPPPGNPPTNTSGAMVGEPWVGDPGQTETIADIMKRPIEPHAPIVEYEAPQNATQQNPDSPQIASFGGPGTPGPELPQSLALSFVGESYSVDNIGIAPPDSMGAIGPSQFLFASNGYIRTFTRSGALDGVLNTTMDNFFLSVRTPCVTNSQCLSGQCPAAKKCGTSDPRVFYDRATQRWFVVMIDVANQSRVMIAVSSAASMGTITAASNFTFFQFRNDTVGTCGVGCTDHNGFFDQPTLGVDNLALYIGGSEFGATGMYVGTTGFVVQKSSVLGAGPIVVTAFRQLTAGAAGAGPGSPKGVSNDNPASTEGYFIGSDNATQGLLVVRRITTPGGVPAISGNINVTVPTTAYPPDAPGKGSVAGTCYTDPGCGGTVCTTGAADTSDNRLIQAEMRNGSLWAAHQIGTDASGVGSAAGDRASIRFYEIINMTGTPTLNQAGTIWDPAASNPNFFFYPGLVMSGQGHVAIGSSYSGKNSFYGTAYSGRLAGDALGTARAPTLVASANSYNLAIFNCSGSWRWGDYSFTSVDPNDNMTMWTTQEFADATDSWAVRVTKLLAPPPATPSSASPPSAPQGSTGISVTITGTAVSGSGFYDPGASFPNHIGATVNCAGVTVNSVAYTSPTSITLNVTISAGAPTNPSCTVTVTNPDGQSVTSASGIFGCGKANGAICGGAGECLSGNCVGGICCNTPCGSCGSCSTGMCTNVYGADACSPEVCSGSSPTCPTTCSSDAGCAFGFFCSGTACVASNVANGSPCTTSAQCLSGFCAMGGTCQPGWDWSNGPVATGDVSAATILNGVAYYFTDASLNGLNLATGMPIAPAYVAGGSIENFPEVVTLADGKTYVFFTAADGYLYKIDAGTLALVKRLQLATAPDTLQATPAVQLAAFSSTNFKNTLGGRDLVYVLTHHAADTTANQVIAIDAAAMTLPAVWTFTGAAPHPMDYGSEGCSIDYANDRLYCGTNQPAAQETLWAIDTVGGARLWSVNAGSLHNRPQLANGVLYVANRSATLRAYDPVTGNPKWPALPLPGGTGVSLNLWAEFRVSPTQVFVTDQTGVVYDVVDNGGSGMVKWQRAFGAAHAITQVSVAPTMMLAFVGLDDGTLHQLDLGTGTDAKHSLVLHANAPTPGNLVVEPTLAIENAAPDINKMVCSSAGNFGTITKQLAVPLP